MQSYRETTEAMTAGQMYSCDGCKGSHMEQGGGDGWFAVCDDAEYCDSYHDELVEQMKDAVATRGYMWEQMEAAREAVKSSSGDTITANIHAATVASIAYAECERYAEEIGDKVDAWEVAKRQRATAADAARRKAHTPVEPDLAPLGHDSLRDDRATNPEDFETYPEVTL